MQRLRLVRTAAEGVGDAKAAAGERRSEGCLLCCSEGGLLRSEGGLLCGYFHRIQEKEDECCFGHCAHYRKVKWFQLMNVPSMLSNECIWIVLIEIE